MIIKKEAVKDHESILNDVAKDLKLNDNARGLYLRLFMTPEGQELDEESIEAGRDTWRSWLCGMKQLEKNGYIHIESVQNPRPVPHFGLSYVNECRLMGRVEK